MINAGRGATLLLAAASMTISAGATMAIPQVAAAALLTPQASCYDFYYAIDGVMTQDQRYTCSSASAGTGYAASVFSGADGSNAQQRTGTDAVYFASGHALVDDQANPEVGYAMFYMSPNKDQSGPYKCSAFDGDPTSAARIGTLPGCTVQGQHLPISAYQWSTSSVPGHREQLAVLEGCGTFANQGGASEKSIGVWMAGHGVGNTIGFVQPITAEVDYAGYDQGPAWSWASYFWQDIQNGSDYGTAAADGVSHVRAAFNGNANNYDSWWWASQPGAGSTLGPARYF